MSAHHTLHLNIDRLILRWVAEAIHRMPQGSATQAGYWVTLCFYSDYTHLSSTQRRQLLHALQALHLQGDAGILEQIQKTYGHRYTQAIRTLIHVVYSIKMPNELSLKQLQKHLVNYMLFDVQHQLKSPYYNPLCTVTFQALTTTQSNNFKPLDEHYWPQIESLQLLEMIGRDDICSSFLAKHYPSETSDSPKSELLHIQVGHLKNIDFFDKYLDYINKKLHVSSDQNPSSLDTQKVNTQEPAIQEAHLHFAPPIAYGSIQGFSPLFWIATPHVEKVTLTSYIDLGCSDIVAHTLALQLIDAVLALHRIDWAHANLSTNCCILNEQNQLQLHHISLHIFLPQITGMLVQQDQHITYLKKYLHIDAQPQSIEEFQRSIHIWQKLDVHMMLHIIHALYTGSLPHYDSEQNTFTIHSSLPKTFRSIFVSLWRDSTSTITAQTICDTVKQPLQNLLNAHNLKKRYDAWRKVFKSRDLLAFVHQNKGQEITSNHQATSQFLVAESFFHFAPQLQLLHHQSLSEMIQQLNQVERKRYQQQNKIKELSEQASRYEDLAIGIAQEMIERLEDMSGQDIYESLDEITQLKSKYLQAAQDKVDQEQEELRIARNKHMRLIQQLKQLHKSLLKKEVKKYAQHTQSSKKNNEVPSKKNNEVSSKKNNDSEENIQNSQRKKQVHHKQDQNSNENSNQKQSNHKKSIQKQVNTQATQNVTVKSVANQEIVDTPISAPPSLDSPSQHLQKNGTSSKTSSSNDDHHSSIDKSISNTLQAEEMSPLPINPSQVDHKVNQHITETHTVDDSSSQVDVSQAPSIQADVSQAPSIQADVSQAPSAQITTQSEKSQSELVRSMETAPTEVLPTIIPHEPDTISQSFFESPQFVRDALIPQIGRIQTILMNENISMNWCYCPAGSFEMGNFKNQGDKDEKPRHIVHLTQGFWMSQTVITQQQWQDVMGHNPSQYQGMNYPVERVNWFECVSFCNQLSILHQLVPAYHIQENQSVIWNEKANGYRLPTEAEWEYAAKAQQEYHFSGSLSLKEVAWYNNSSQQKVHEVGVLKANQFGLKDMSGLVWEWCHDIWDAKAYQDREEVYDPCIYQNTGNRVFRGGSWNSSSYECRVTCRSGFEPSIRWGYRGFRICLPHIINA